MGTISAMKGTTIKIQGHGWLALVEGYQTHEILSSCWQYHLSVIPSNHIVPFVSAFRLQVAGDEWKDLPFTSDQSNLLDHSWNHSVFE
jgi:hypothetical protein